MARCHTNNVLPGFLIAPRTLRNPIVIALHDLTDLAPAVLTVFSETSER